MDIITNIIKELRRKGHTQIEMAEYLGISTNNITDWKAGRSNSYMKYLPKIAEYLGVSVDYLAGTEKPSAADADRELQEYLQELKTRPEMKMLFMLLLLLSFLATVLSRENLMWLIVCVLVGIIFWQILARTNAEEQASMLKIVAILAYIISTYIFSFIFGLLRSAWWH